MITTRESINFQFSMIFGYSSPIENNITVGDIIGPGKLTKKKVKELSHNVINFLAQYNAMLRDYTGSEVFSIEFELFNFEEEYMNKTITKIYPKSMILLPGNYKDSDSLILALKPDVGYLNIHKSNSSLNNVSKLFYEIEEFIQRPELNRDEKEKILSAFAERFSKKLYGKLIENKWNKKLIGITETLPTEKDLLTSYASIKSNLKINWHKVPYEILFYNPSFKRIPSEFESKAAKEHLKYLISEPSADFVVKNTLKLGRDLFKLVNTGTIDDTQEGIIRFILFKIKKVLKNNENPISPNEFIMNIEEIISELKRVTNKSINICKDFLKTGKKGELPNLLEDFKIYINEKVNPDEFNLDELQDILFSLIENSINEKEIVRANELNSIVNYFSEIIFNSFELIKEKLPRFLTLRRMLILTSDFIASANQLFLKEKEPAKIIATDIIEKFKIFLLQKIELLTFKIRDKVLISEKEVINEFKNLYKENIDDYFEEINLGVNDIIQFAEVMLDEKAKVIKTHIEKFKKFTSEIQFLLGYILRYSTINRFLKINPDKEISDPVTFANKFYRFTEKRLGGIDLSWKSYILEWIKDYAKIFFKLREERNWTVNEIIVDFIKYLEERETKEIKVENFKNFLDTFIAKIEDSDQKPELILFLEQYEYCLGIKEEFPRYLKQQIKKHFEVYNFNLKKELPKNYFKLSKTKTFFDYLLEKELKYYSKLIPRPISLVLRHNLSNEEMEEFNNDFFHILSFKYWGQDYLKYEISDNFKQVYREWIKEL